MHVNDMPSDCVLLLLEEASSRMSLTDVVQKSFVCNKWFEAVSRMMGGWRGTSLKLFNSEMNFDNYRQFVIQDTELNARDERFNLNDRSGVSWKQQDHLCLRRFTDTALDVITKVLQAHFAEAVTSLVVNTFDIDQVEVLKAFPNLTTITLIELPESKRIQTDIWQHLATQDNLRHLNIFHCDNTIPLNVALMRPILRRLETFTLHQYNHPNRIELLNCLDSNVCQQFCLGKFGSVLRAHEFRLTLQKTQPELSQRLAILDRSPPVPLRHAALHQMNYFRRSILVSRWLQTLFTDFPEERPEWIFLNPNPNRDQVRLAQFRHAFVQRLNVILAEGNGAENPPNEDALYAPFFQLYEQFRRGDWLPEMQEIDVNDIAQYLNVGEALGFRPFNMLNLAEMRNAVLPPLPPNIRGENRARRNLLRNFVGILNFDIDNGEADEPVFIDPPENLNINLENVVYRNML